MQGYQQDSAKKFKIGVDNKQLSCFNTHMNYTKGENDMAQRPYDATKEHAKVDKTRLKDSKGRHPNKGRKDKHPVSGK